MHRMRNTATEHEPTFPIGAERNNLVARCSYFGRVVGRFFQFASYEFATTPTDVADVDCRYCCLARQWRKPAIGNTAINPVVENNLVENPVVTFSKVSAI